MHSDNDHCNGPSPPPSAPGQDYERPTFRIVLAKPLMDQAPLLVRDLYINDVPTKFSHVGIDFDERGIVGVTLELWPSDVIVEVKPHDPEIDPGYAVAKLVDPLT